MSKIGLGVGKELKKFGVKVKMKKTLIKLLILSLIILVLRAGFSMAYFSDTEGSVASVSTGIWETSTPTPEEWDKSSLHFDDDYGCQGSCEEISAKVCNDEDSEDMQGPTTWELYLSDSGNPKDGEVVSESGGTIDPLEHGTCLVLSYNPNGVEGNYMFKAEQRPGHPGQGVLWSEACEIESCTSEEQNDEVENTTIEDVMLDETSTENAF